MRTVIGMLGLVCVLVITACSEVSPDAALTTARDQVNRGDHAQAVLTLKSLLQQHPGQAEARLLLGRALLASGDAAGAQAELQRALEAGETLEAVLPALAIAMNQQGQGAQLLSRYGTTSLASPEGQLTWVVELAKARLAAGDVAGAEDTLRPALQAPGSGVEARLLAARIAAVQGALPDALARLDAVLRDAPGHADAWLLKAQLLQRTGGDRGAVVDALRRALAARPDDIEAHTGLVSIFLAQRDLDAAGTQVDALRRARPQHAQTAFLAALLADAKGDHAKVRDLTQPLLNAAPDSPRVLVLAGKAQSALGSLSQAESLLGKAVQVSPKSAAPRRLLAEVYLKQGKPDKAAAVLKPLLGQDDADAMALAAQAALQSGDFVAAAAGFARAVQLKPGDTRLRTAALTANLGRNDDDRVLSALQTLAASDLQSADADMALISAHMARKAFGPALKAVDAAAAKHPKAAWPEQVRGSILLQRGDRAGARKHFELALGKEPNHFGAVAQLAGMDLADRQPATALARFEALRQRDPQQSATALAIADIRLQTGAPAADVEALLRQVAAAHPGDATVQARLIDFLLSHISAKEAVAAATKATATLPQDAELLDRLGRAQLADGELSQAAVTFGRMAMLRPESALPHLRLAQAHLAMDKPDLVNTDLRKAQALEPAAPAVQNALLAKAMGDRRHADALAIARDVQQRRPGDPAGLLMQGDVEAGQERWDAAEAAYRQALARFAGDAVVAQRLHVALRRGGKAADADRLARDWLASHPDSLVFRHYLAGLALSAKDWLAAEAAYTDLADRRPSDVVALNNLAMAKLALKKPDALPIAQRAVALAPNRAPTLDTLASALSAAGQMDQAVQWQQRAVAMAPNAPGLRLNLARLYAGMGENDRAQAELAILAKLGTAFSGHEEVRRLYKPAGAAPSAPAQAGAAAAPASAARGWFSGRTAAMAAGTAAALALPLALLVAALRPAQFKVSRTIAIDAPAARVFNLLQDLRTWEDWSTDQPFRPGVTRRFPRNPTGLGAVCDWSDKRRNVAGSLEIFHVAPPSRLAVELNVSQPAESRQMSEFLLAQDTAQRTSVTWVQRGDAPFRLRLACVLRGVDRHIGRQIAASLARLQGVSEQSTRAGSPSGDAEGSPVHS